MFSLDEEKTPEVEKETKLVESLFAGVFVGVLFGVMGLSISALPALADLMGIVGIFIGYMLVY